MEIPLPFGFLLRLLIWALFYTQACHTEDRIHMRSEKCNYLMSTADQYNSYIQNNVLCCMCSAGTKWSGDCNDSHPNTTRCEACHFNPDDPHDRYFVNFEPHLQEKCFIQKVLHCVPPKVLGGSTTEEASCVCPSGMKENSSSNGCTTVVHTTPPSTLVSRILENSSAESGHIYATSPGEVKLGTEEGETTTFQYPPTTPGLRATVLLKDRAEMTGINQGMTIAGIGNVTDPDLKNPVEIAENVKWPLVGIAVGVGCLFLIFAVVLWLRRRRASKESNGSADSKSRSLIRKKQERADDSPHGSAELGTSTTDVGTAAGMIADEEPIEYTEENAGKNSAGPLVDGGGVHGPQPENPPGPGNSRWTVMERNKEFARNVATKMGSEVQNRDVPMVFRMLIEKKCDNEIDDILRQYSGTSEQIFQLMRLAQQKLGSDLTPEYIREKFSALEEEYRNLIDIVDDEMRENYMQQR